MTKPVVSLHQYLCNVGMNTDTDLLREGISLLTKFLMNMEVSQQIGREQHERAQGREALRNGCRERS